MARVGRGRSRGGRILEIPVLNVGGRGMGIGRGIAVPCSTNGVVNKKPAQFDDVEDQRDTFLEELSKMQKTGDGCFLRLSVNYFLFSNDADHFVDKVIESVIKNSQLVTRFAMSLKLITLLKSHGEKIKSATFKKLQTTFQDMQVLMKDDSILSSVERDTLHNFCDLLGQLFFRFRVNLGSPDRYGILSVPTIHCLNHLLRSRTVKDLQLLIRLLLLNRSALLKLQQDRLMELSVSMRSECVEESRDRVRTLWLMAAIDIVASSGNQLQPEVERFYADKLGSAWNETMLTSPIELLVAIPFDISQSHMDKFDVVQNQYNKSRLIDL